MDRNRTTVPIGSWLGIPRLGEWMGCEDLHDVEATVGRAAIVCEALELAPETVLDHTDGGARCSIFAAALTALLGDEDWLSLETARGNVTESLPQKRSLADCLDDVRRIVLRHDTSEAEKGLASAARSCGVTDYAAFQNAGYHGFYRQDMRSLKRLRDPTGTVCNRVLFDFCGVHELALHRYRLNALRIRLAEARARGQEHAERLAGITGQGLRRLVVNLFDRRPENLPLFADIHEVQRFWRRTAKEMKTLKMTLDSYAPM